MRNPTVGFTGLCRHLAALQCRPPVPDSQNWSAVVFHCSQSATARSAAGPRPRSRNQCMFKHSSRSLPLKLSMIAFSTGRSGVTCPPETAPDEEQAHCALTFTPETVQKPD